MADEASDEGDNHVGFCRVRNARRPLRHLFLPSHMVKRRRTEAATRVQRRRRRGGHVAARLDRTSVKLRARKLRNLGVHAILHLQHAHWIASVLQALEEALLKVGGDGALADDCRRQLHWISDQKHLLDSRRQWHKA